jgi:hypothetical protein
MSKENNRDRAEAFMSFLYWDYLGSIDLKIRRNGPALLFVLL